MASPNKLTAPGFSVAATFDALEVDALTCLSVRCVSNAARFTGGIWTAAFGSSLKAITLATSPLNAVTSGGDFRDCVSAELANLPICSLTIGSTAVRHARTVVCALAKVTADNSQEAKQQNVN